MVRRDTRFLVEGEVNKRLVIIGRGEARIHKQMRR
jgi:hypothetical protein